MEYTIFVRMYMSSSGKVCLERSDNPIDLAAPAHPLGKWCSKIAPVVVTTEGAPMSEVD